MADAAAGGCPFAALWQPAVNAAATMALGAVGMAGARAAATLSPQKGDEDGEREVGRRGRGKQARQQGEGKGQEQLTTAAMLCGLVGVSVMGLVYHAVMPPSATKARGQQRRSGRDSVLELSPGPTYLFCFEGMAATGLGQTL